MDDKVVLTATGFNENQMRPLSWDVRKWAGKTGRLQIVDAATGGWGNIGVDDIVFSDKPREPVGPLSQQGDFGTMGLALLDPQPGDFGCTALPGTGVPAGIFSTAEASAGLGKERV